ncbi:hypothetical protein [Streptomyces pratensis]|uniref:hypothetical protein n=1 Tax=Streptomyces pratensis TaxID=1169025 RepID=UPI00301A472D
MDVRAALLRAAAARPRVLLVTTPGGTPARLAAERELRLRDWPSASTPAGADLLFVAGPEHPPLRPALERLWQDMPQPRARAHAAEADDVPSRLDVGRARLASPHRQRSDAVRHAPEGLSPGGPGAEHGARAASPGGADDGGAGSGHGSGHGHGHDGGPPGGGDGEGHGGHGHGDTEMPGGLPMAEQGPDRDGLALDRLHVPLGPFLADWPAGLGVRVVMQGDVVQRAELDEPPADGTARPFWARPWVRAAAGEPVSVGEAARRRAAAHLDSLGRLLAVAGWPAGAVTAQRLRDDLLGQASAAALLPRTRRFARRVGRSRTLYWLTRGIGPVSAAAAEAAGVSGPAARADGDVPARYRQWLADVLLDVGRLDCADPLDPVALQSPRGRWDAARPPSAALAALLPGLLVGAELGAARLIVAGLDPDPDEWAACPAWTAHG